MKYRVALGLSGGVDSAVSAYLLKKQGYDVYCIYLNCYDSDDPTCRAKTDRADALKVALHLKLPFQVLDFRKQYQAAVIDYFKKEYLAGRTPNPDVVCNRDIKFGLFLDWAIKNHFDYVATGHYAKLNPLVPNQTPSSVVILNSDVASDEGSSESASDTNISIGASRLDCHVVHDPVVGTPRNDEKTLLVRPADEHKDQTYFLWQVPREKFQRVLFPLADYLKSEVRQIARKIKLPVAAKKDSTGICFIGEISVEEFLKRLGVKEKRGEVVIKVPNSKLQITNKSQIPSSKSRTGENLNLEFGNCNLLGTCDLDLGASSNYQVIGSHKGVWFYTIGQRHGFEIIRTFVTHSREGLLIRDKIPLYVISKDIKTNRLVVGFGPECYRSQFFVSQINWLTTDYSLPARNASHSEAGGPTTASKSVAVTFDSAVVSSQWSVDCLARLRHCGDLIECQLSANRYPLIAIDSKRITNNDLRFTVRLEEPQRGIAPGQSAVFYSKDGTVLGGGVIQ